MFDEGTNAVTMNLPKQVEIQRREAEKELNLPLTEPTFVDDGFSNNFLESEFINMANSLDQQGKICRPICLISEFD